MVSPRPGCQSAGSPHPLRQTLSLSLKAECIRFSGWFCENFNQDSPHTTLPYHIPIPLYFNQKNLKYRYGTGKYYTLLSFSLVRVIFSVKWVIEEVEKRDRLQMILPWLEQLKK